MSFTSESPKVEEIIFHIRSHEAAKVVFLTESSPEAGVTGAVLEYPSGGTSHYYIEELDDMWTRIPLAHAADTRRRTPR